MFDLDSCVFLFGSLRECNLSEDMFTVEVPFALRNNQSAHRLPYVYSKGIV